MRRWSQQQSPKRGRTGGRCDSDSMDSNCGSRKNNTKLLNHNSVFHWNNAFALRRYSDNSVNNGNLNRNGAVDSYLSILLALIALSIMANLENFLFGTFISIIYFDVFVLNIILEWRWKDTRPMRLGRWEGLGIGALWSVARWGSCIIYGCTKGFVVVGCSLAGAPIFCAWLRYWTRTPRLLIRSSRVDVS